MTTLNATKVLKSLTILLVSAIALFSLYVYIALNWSYSSGERAGFLQKVSHKGWICKTWEGELSLVAMPGSAPEKFLFTVRDEAVAQKVSAAAGKRVTLNYEQHKGLPSSCFGDTEYFVVDVKEIE
ncbi:MAG: hypothetical protein ACK5AP_00390 [Burkholderiales bacterium]|jgi:hypothetical protein|nr:hypothetical protein [Limnohabitans sp.]